MTNPSEVSPLCALLTTLAQPSGLKLNLADARLPPSQSSAPETAVGPRASLDHLSHGHNVRLRTYQGATPLHLYATAQRAASLADTHAHIQTATRHLSHPLWQQSRTWDPDD